MPASLTAVEAATGTRRVLRQRLTKPFGAALGGSSTSDAYLLGQAPRRSRGSANCGPGFRCPPLAGSKRCGSQCSSLTVIRKRLGGPSGALVDVTLRIMLDP